MYFHLNWTKIRGPKNQVTLNHNFNYHLLISTAIVSTVIMDSSYQLCVTGRIILRNASWSCYSRKGPNLQLQESTTQPSTTEEKISLPVPMSKDIRHYDGQINSMYGIEWVSICNKNKIQGSGRQFIQKTQVQVACVSNFMRVMQHSHDMKQR